jgi:hypothetical protein
LGMRRNVLQTRTYVNEDVTRRGICCPTDVRAARVDKLYDRA